MHTTSSLLVMTASAKPEQPKASVALASSALSCVAVTPQALGQHMWAQRIEATRGDLGAAIPALLPQRRVGHTRRAAASIRSNARGAQGGQCAPYLKGIPHQRTTMTLEAKNRKKIRSF